jgi:hypothetical protein
LTISEADPSNYAGLAQSRPDAVNVHAGLCDKPQTLHYTNTPRAAINGFVEFMSPPFLAQWHPRLVANPQLILSLPFVHCLPLSMILRHLKIKHIDVWILDIEGAEYFALQGVNWGAVSISTIVMESDFTNRTREVQKIDFLKSKGYICEMVSTSFRMTMFTSSPGGKKCNVSPSILFSITDKQKIGPVWCKA